MRAKVRSLKRSTVQRRRRLCWIALLAVASGTVPVMLPLLRSTWYPRFVSVEIVANGTSFDYRYNLLLRYYKGMPDSLQRYPFLPRPNEVPDDQRICFVHVGELG